MTVHRLSRREAMPRPPVARAELEVDDDPRPPPKNEDEKIAGWCVEMLARGRGTDMTDVDYVRHCARREADTIRPSRPDLAAKLDAVAATLTERLPLEMR